MLWLTPQHKGRGLKSISSSNTRFFPSHFKPSKDLLIAFMNEAIKLKMDIFYEPFVKPEDRPDVAHEPTVRGFFCRKCRHRFDDEHLYDLHLPACLAPKKQPVVVVARPEGVKNKRALVKRHERDVKRAQKLDRELEKRIKNAGL